MKQWLARAFSFTVAWAIILLALGVVGELLDTEKIAPLITLWISVGILVRVLLSPAEVEGSLPSAVDIGSAVRFLLVSCAWPVFLANRN